MAKTLKKRATAALQELQPEVRRKPRLLKEIQSLQDAVAVILRILVETDFKDTAMRTRKTCAMLESYLAEKKRRKQSQGKAIQPPPQHRKEPIVESRRKTIPSPPIPRAPVCGNCRANIATNQESQLCAICQTKVDPKTGRLPGVAMRHA